MKSPFLKVLLVFVGLAGFSGLFSSADSRNTASIRPIPAITQAKIPQPTPTTATLADAEVAITQPGIQAEPKTSPSPTPTAQLETKPVDDTDAAGLNEPKQTTNAKTTQENELSQAVEDEPQSRLSLFAESLSSSKSAQDQSTINENNLNGTLVINKIDLTSGIVTVPVVDNRWPVEDLGQDVGLLQGGGRFPQDEKAMIFAGHATTFWPIKGPFAGIDKLLPNDEIVYIHNNDKYTYQISRLIWAEPDQINILDSDNGDQIILVTCGQYNYYEGSFERRLVVLADLIDVQPISFN